MKIDGETLIFESTGKKESFSYGIIGLRIIPGQTPFYTCVYEGYDAPTILSKEETRELAEYMISAWTKVAQENA